ncbi:hypothetical protein BGZ79_004362 [Entomortierella chlamydospora]|nr:hypothetical protein BGZ79_004362 [Entomortierella chlamydospora]
MKSEASEAKKSEQASPSAGPITYADKNKKALAFSLGRLLGQHWCPAGSHRVYQGDFQTGGGCEARSAAAYWIIAKQATSLSPATAVALCGRRPSGSRFDALLAGSFDSGTLWQRRTCARQPSPTYGTSVGVCISNPSESMRLIHGKINHQALPAISLPVATRGGRAGLLLSRNNSENGQ